LSEEHVFSSYMEIQYEKIIEIFDDKRETLEVPVTE
jgi:hypothetical protein